MFKTLIACSAVALASSQGLQALAEQANAVLSPLLNQENPVTLNGKTLSLVVNNYEWSLTEQGNEYEFGVDQLAENADNLAPALSALLAGANPNAQAAADNVLNAEAESVGVALENSTPAADAAGQLADNSEALNNLAQNQYNNAAEALANNAGGLTDQVNQQLNANANNPAAAVNAGVEAATQNAGAAGDLAAQNADAAGNLAAENLGSPAPATAAVLNAAGNPSTTETANNLADAAGQAVNAGQDAANANLPQDLANNANDAANAAGTAAADNLNGAADQLNNNGVADLSEAANVANEAAGNQ